MKIFIFVVGLLFPYVLSAQHISGKVTNTNNEPLAGASLHWKNTAIGITTDINGRYKLTTKDISNKTLIVSYVGHVSQVLEISDQSEINVILEASESLDEVVIKSQREGVIISSLSPIKTELLTQTELAKAACCDLAGCFETQTTVQAQTTNVITNSKELRILGLSGVYNQVLINGFPMIQGLSYTYGISSIPGTLVDNIYISKGANSVLQGFESISGQINVETKDPAHTDMLLLNAYINSFSEKHFNANYAFKKGKWSNLTAVSTVQPANAFDKDEDTFLDLPKLTRYMVFNTLKYGNDAHWGWNSELGLRFVNEQRIGGQTNFNANTDKGSHDIYGQTVNFNQPEVWTKTGYRMNDQHNFVLYASSFYQNQNSYFGTVKYDAEQTNVFANLQHEFNYGAHTLKSGISFKHLDIDEDVAFTYNALNRTYDGDYFRNENIIGAFAENTMTLFDDKLTWIAGIRVDNHNEFGTKVTPRTLLKYDITPKTIIRANIGTGWRTVNLFSENIGLLVSSRDIVFKEALEPEQALNTGINITQKFETNNFNGFFSADFYHTNFKNQIFPDYDTDPTKAIIENFRGKSVSNVFQVEVSLNIYEQFEFKTGYSYLDVYREIDGEKELLPFNPKHKVVTNLGYKPISNTYRMDVNFHWYGEQRLPDTQSNPEVYRRPDFSENYAILNAQFTYNLNRVELYTGCENIFDFRQEQPILSWQDPFGEYFDTSSVWGPTRGREFYLGVRYKIPSK
ncbi:TonB-dependent receptor [Formosa sp. 3Alg 14/1]|uniref:TonB-dependent receptor n=1 Tax=Formosa sp. 3Alg 14/1 TaxID=3382190 RepID=UPI0039BDCCA0